MRAFCDMKAGVKKGISHFRPKDGSPFLHQPFCFMGVFNGTKLYRKQYHHFIETNY
jgi:hypothetical protein